MPLNSASSEAKSRRPPGRLPNVLRYVEDCTQKIENLNPSMKAMLKPVLEPLLDMAREQNRLNMMEWARVDALPSKHANTHLGNSDNLVSNVNPEPVSLTGEADPGDPHEGVSARGHVHPVGDDIAGLIPLTEVTTEDLNGFDVLYVYDWASNQLLQQILFELMQLTGEV